MLILEIYEFEEEVISSLAYELFKSECLSCQTYKIGTLDDLLITGFYFNWLRSENMIGTILRKSR
jgi:hypothetical protein